MSRALQGCQRNEYLCNYAEFCRSILRSVSTLSLQGNFETELQRNFSDCITARIYLQTKLKLLFSEGEPAFDLNMTANYNISVYW